MIQVIIYTVHEEEKACFVCIISFKLLTGLQFLGGFFVLFLRRQNIADELMVTQNSKW